MAAADALARLMELSTEIVEVVTVDRAGAVEAFSGCAPERAATLARAGGELRALAGGEDVVRVQVERDRGCLFVVVDQRRLAVATTHPDVTAGLVHHDLRTVLRRSAVSGVGG